MSMERVIVHEKIAEEFEQVLKSEAIKAGWVGGMELVRSGAGERAKHMVDQAVRMVRVFCKLFNYMRLTEYLAREPG